MTQDATDTEPEAAAAAPETIAAPDDGATGDDGSRRLPWWAIIVAISALLSAVVLAGRLFGVGPAILVLAATALLVVVGFLFRAVQSAAEPPEDDDVVALAPTLAEEQKRAALRALKELEFEKSVGNISPEDYAVIVGRYREEAKRAMRAVDEERKGMRERAEKLARKAIVAEVGEAPVIDPRKNPFPAEDAPEGEGADANKDLAAETDTICPKCGVGNDDDARFCKGCGAPIGDVA
jgi:hypothetical protein